MSHVSRRPAAVLVTLLSALLVASCDEDSTRPDDGSLISAYIDGEYWYSNEVSYRIWDLGYPSLQVMAKDSLNRTLAFGMRFGGVGSHEIGALMSDGGDRWVGAGEATIVSMDTLVWSARGSFHFRVELGEGSSPLVERVVTRGRFDIPPP